MRFLIIASIMLFAACTPSEPAPTTPVRNVDYRVTTTASMADQRFLVEFRSLSERELCISANDWPTGAGALGVNRGVEDGDAVRRVRAGETASAFVRFDQVEPAQRRGEAAQQVDFSPQPVFCAAVLQ